MKNVMKLKYALVFLLMTMLFSPGLSQDDETLSLRELADANDLYIGAAVYTYHLDTESHQEVLVNEFNMLTPENEAKFCELQPEQGVYTFDRLDRLVELAEANDMTVRGHTLLWHECMPDWLARGDFTREEAIDIMRDHIYTVVERYKGRIPIWDVVNEAIDGGNYRRTPWLRMIGPEYIELAFQFAHEADPDAILFYNDYGAEGMNTKSQAIYTMVSDMVMRGVPIHGVGLQSHITVGDTLGWLAPGNLTQNIQRIADLGLEVHITEMDVKYQGEATDEILQQQAGDYHRFMQVCLEIDACTAFIVWGVSDGYTWLRDPQFYDNPEVEPLLFDSDYEPKPAYFALADLLARNAGLDPILSDEELDAMLAVPEIERIEVDIPEPAKSDPEQLAPDEVAGAVYYAAYPVGISLDGDLSDWANVPKVTIDSGPLLPEDHDTQMTFAVVADDQFIYLMADVVDSQVVYGVHEPASEWYLEDSVEFYINATGDLELRSYQRGVVQIAIPAANVQGVTPPIIAGGNSADIEVELFATQTDDGYRIEAAVPLLTSAWEIIPEHLGELGFQAHLNGTSADDRDTKLIWSVYDTVDQSWTNPNLFGKLIFWNIQED